MNSCAAEGFGWAEQGSDSAVHIVRGYMKQSDAPGPGKEASPPGGFHQRYNCFFELNYVQWITT